MNKFLSVEKLAKKYLKLYLEQRSLNCWCKCSEIPGYRELKSSVHNITMNDLKENFDFFNNGATLDSMISENPHW